MRTRLLLLSMLAMVLIAGCATSYHKKGITGGYSETRLGENVYMVTFKGNAYASKERTADFCLLRCAELALLNGYFYFVIIDASSDESRSLYTTPITSTKAGPTTVTQGGQTYIITKPSNSNTIICFKEKPSGFHLDAAFVKQSITEKYSLERGDGRGWAEPSDGERPPDSDGG